MRKICRFLGLRLTTQSKVINLKKLRTQRSCFLRAPLNRIVISHYKMKSRYRGKSGFYWRELGKERSRVTRFKMKDVALTNKEVPGK